MTRNSPEKNQTILHFVNILFKVVPLNISYPSTVNQIDGYLDASISLTYVNMYHQKGQANKLQ